MSFDLLTFTVVLLLFGASLWLAAASGRLHATWKTASGRSGQLKQRLGGYARLMASSARETERINEDIKRTREDIDAAVKTAAAKRKELADTQPPPPPEIDVAAEYPPSETAKPWVAHYKRSTTARLPGEPRRRNLIWAADHNAAVNRAEQEHRQEYQVASVHRLD